MEQVINFFHRSLSRTTMDTSAQDLKRTQIFLHCAPLTLYQRALLFFPSGTRVRVVSRVSSFFIRNKWLIHHHRLLFARMLISSVYFASFNSHFFVAHLHQPIYLEDSRKAFVLESVKLVMLSYGLCHGLCLGTIYQDCNLVVFETSCIYVP